MPVQPTAILYVRYTQNMQLKSLATMTFSYFTKKTSQEKLVRLLEVQEEIKQMKHQHLAPCPSKTEQTQFNNSDLDQGWRQAGKPQFNSQFCYAPSVLQGLVVLKSANVANLLQLLPLCNGKDCTYLH